MLAPFNRLFLLSACALGALIVSGAEADKSPAPAPGSGRPEVRPLYPVRREPPLPDAEDTFRQVFSLLLKEYYTDAVDPQSLYWAAIQGMLRWVSPPNKPDLGHIWTPEEYERIEESLEGERESIGIRSSYNPNDGSLTVTLVRSDGPCAGILQPYDRIVRIDGKPLKGLQVREIDDLLAGPAGSKVTLKVVRDASVFDVTVTRAAVRIAPCTVTVLPGGVLLARIPSFTSGVSRELSEGLKEKGAGCRGIIVDLRGDGGGVFIESLKCAELFIPARKVMLRVVSHGSRIQSYVSSNDAPLRMPLAVLVDGDSASASEIFAAAVRDSAGAVVVGERTFGKASMEKTFTLKNGYRVRFTIGALYSPAGRTWQGRGIEPDIPAARPKQKPGRLEKLPVAERLRYDPPLRAAWTFLRGPNAGRPGAGEKNHETERRPRIPPPERGR